MPRHQITPVVPEEAVILTTSAPAAPAFDRQETVGVQLRRAREARDESLARIADWLRIKPEYLHALEEGLHDQLPALTYATGFLKNYADYLGLDSVALREAFRREMMDKLTPQLTLPQPIPEGKTPPWPVIIGALLVAAMVYGGWTLTQGMSRPAIEPPQPPKQMLGAEPAAAPAENPALEQSAALPSPGKVEQHFGELEKPTRRIIRAEHDVWLTITDAQDKVLFSQMMYAGDTYHVPEQSGLKLTTGNADSLILTLDGVAQPKLGKVGQVLRDSALDKVK